MVIIEGKRVLVGPENIDWAVGEGSSYQAALEEQKEAFAGNLFESYLGHIEYLFEKFSVSEWTGIKFSFFEEAKKFLTDRDRDLKLEVDVDGLSQYLAAYVEQYVSGVGFSSVMAPHSVIALGESYSTSISDMEYKETLPYYERAMYYLGEGDILFAMANLELAYLYNPDDMEMRTKGSEILEKGESKYGDVEKFYVAIADKLQKETGPDFLMLGAVYKRLAFVTKEQDKIIEYAEKSLEFFRGHGKEPFISGAEEFLYGTEKYFGQYDAAAAVAKKRVERLVALPDTNTKEIVEALFKVAEAYLYAEKPDEAEKYYSVMLLKAAGYSDTTSSYFGPLLLLYLSRLEEMDAAVIYEKGKQTLDMLMKKIPDEILCHFAMGRILEKLGNYEGARKAYLYFAENSEDNPYSDSDLVGNAYFRLSGITDVDAVKKYEYLDMAADYYGKKRGVDRSVASIVEIRDVQCEMVTAGAVDRGIFEPCYAAGVAHLENDNPSRAREYFLLLADIISENASGEEDLGKLDEVLKSLVGTVNEGSSEDEQESILMKIDDIISYFPADTYAYYQKARLLGLMEKSEEELKLYEWIIAVESGKAVPDYELVQTVCISILAKNEFSPEKMYKYAELGISAAEKGDPEGRGYRISGFYDYLLDAAAKTGDAEKYLRTYEKVRVYYLEELKDDTGAFISLCSAVGKEMVGFARAEKSEEKRKKYYRIAVDLFINEIEELIKIGEVESDQFVEVFLKLAEALVEVDEADLWKKALEIIDIAGEDLLAYPEFARGFILSRGFKRIDEARDAYELFIHYESLKSETEGGGYGSEKNYYLLGHAHYNLAVWCVTDAKRKREHYQTAIEMFKRAGTNEDGTYKYQSLIDRAQKKLEKLVF